MKIDWDFEGMSIGAFAAINSYEFSIALRQGQADKIEVLINEMKHALDSFYTYSKANLDES